MLPEHDVVLAMTGQSDDMQAVLDAAWQYLLPAISGPPSSAADEALAARLATLSLPAIGNSPFDLTASFSPSASNPREALTAVHVLDGTRVALDDSGERIEFALGRGEWAVTDVIAASGSWVETPGGELAIDIRFLETPHTLRVNCHPATSTFEAVWATEPLQSTALGEMRMPRHG